MTPTVGRIVYYYPTKEEQELMNNYQTVAPAIITAVWSDSCVNLKVMYDGNFNAWKTSVYQSLNKAPSSWNWPEIK